ncbi:hypothetical protein FAM09_18000 [Niastella caeni]|uniref:DUF6089 domain-containing protein n=1 Tax=Niastella caeni TaxID=2569763 RepID=A0A4S8HNB3_9BACT|nr:DUF6089 family protein [Niastella caeni]THU36858.1 hypothetical protein FAM09_18000 [Niastella caeni]
MKVNPGKAIAISFVLCSYFSSARAQLTVPKHEIGFSAGLFVYQGDLTPEAAGAFKSPGIAINVFYNRILSRFFSLRTNLAYGKLRADDGNYDNPAWRQQRNFRFAARNTEISELLVWNILGNNYGNRKIISPYIFSGVGLSSLRITRDWSQFNYDYFASETKTLEGLAADTAHSIPGTIAVIPVGVGVRYAISSKLSIMAEASHRFTFNDYIDGFSKASNPDKNDYYTNYSIGLIYTFGRKNTLDCPPMRY